MPKNYFDLIKETDLKERKISPKGPIGLADFIEIYRRTYQSEISWCNNSGEDVESSEMSPEEKKRRQLKFFVYNWLLNLTPEQKEACTVTVFGREFDSNNLFENTAEIQYQNILSRIHFIVLSLPKNSILVDVGSLCGSTAMLKTKNWDAAETVRQINDTTKLLINSIVSSRFIHRHCKENATKSMERVSLFSEHTQRSLENKRQCTKYDFSTDPSKATEGVGICIIPADGIVSVAMGKEELSVKLELTFNQGRLKSVYAISKEEYSSPESCVELELKREQKREQNRVNNKEESEAIQRILQSLQISVDPSCVELTRRDVLEALNGPIKDSLLVDVQTSIVKNLLMESFSSKSIIVTPGKDVTTISVNSTQLTLPARVSTVLAELFSGSGSYLEFLKNEYNKKVVTSSIIKALQKDMYFKMAMSISFEETPNHETKILVMSQFEGLCLMTVTCSGSIAEIEEKITGNEAATWMASIRSKFQQAEKLKGTLRRKGLPTLNITETDAGTSISNQSITLDLPRTANDILKKSSPTDLDQIVREYDAKLIADLGLSAEQSQVFSNLELTSEQRAFYSSTAIRTLIANGILSIEAAAALEPHICINLESIATAIVNKVISLEQVFALKNPLSESQKKLLNNEVIQRFLTQKKLAFDQALALKSEQCDNLLSPTVQLLIDDQIITLDEALALESKLSASQCEQLNDETIQLIVKEKLLSVEEASELSYVRLQTLKGELMQQFILSRQVTFQQALRIVGILSDEQCHVLNSKDTMQQTASKQLTLKQALEPILSRYQAQILCNDFFQQLIKERQLALKDLDELTYHQSRILGSKVIQHYIATGAITAKEILNLTYVQRKILTSKSIQHYITQGELTFQCALALTYDQQQTLRNPTIQQYIARGQLTFAQALALTHVQCTNITLEAVWTLILDKTITLAQALAVESVLTISQHEALKDKDVRDLIKSIRATSSEKKENKSTKIPACMLFAPCGESNSKDNPDYQSRSPKGP